MSITQQLKDAIGGSAEAVYALAGRAGVDHAQLYRFMSGERDLTLAAADKVCQALQMALSPPVYPPPPAEPDKPRRGRPPGKPKPKPAAEAVSKPAAKVRKAAKGGNA